MRSARHVTRSASQCRCCRLAAGSVNWEARTTEYVRRATAAATDWAALLGRPHPPPVLRA